MTVRRPTRTRRRSAAGGQPHAGRRSCAVVAIGRRSSLAAAAARAGPRRPPARRPAPRPRAPPGAAARRGSCRPRPTNSVGKRSRSPSTSSSTSTYLPVATLPSRTTSGRDRGVARSDARSAPQRLAVARDRRRGCPPRRSARSSSARDRRVGREQPAVGGDHRTPASPCRRPGELRARRPACRGSRGR